MSDINRRTFIKAGAVGVAGMTLGGSFLRSSALPSVAAQEGPLNYTFFVEPGMISQLNSARDQILGYAPWGVRAESAPLLDTLPSHIGLSIEELQAWAEQQEAETLTPMAGTAATTADDVLNQLMQLDIAGAPNVMDMSGDLAAAIASGLPLDAQMEFVYPRELDNVTRIHLPIIQQPTVLNGAMPLIGPDSSAPVLNGPQTRTRFDHTMGMFGWQFRLKGVNHGPVGNCVRTTVRHVTLEILRQNEDGDYVSLLLVQIGAYQDRGKKYFVLNTTGKLRACYKSRKPTWSELFGMLKYIVVAAAAAAGFGPMPLWLVAVIAAPLSMALFIPILLLEIGY